MTLDRPLSAGNTNGPITDAGTRRYELTNHLGNVPITFSETTITHTDGQGNDYTAPQILSHQDYTAFGLEWHRTPGLAGAANYRYRYNGKEFSEELGLYDYGARWYDPAVARWNAVDPLAYEKPWITPYNFVQNDPISRIDPDGLSDYGFNQKTGEITLIKETDDEFDSVYKVRNNGKVRKNSAIDGVEKGILSEGMNLKTDDTVIEVGGDGQPSLGGVEDFLTKFGEMVGLEQAGVYLSDEAGPDASVSAVYIDEYEGNQDRESIITPTKLQKDPKTIGKFVNARFHTHPTNTGNISRHNIDNAGPGDLEDKRKTRGQFHHYYILTREENYPNALKKIPYTHRN